MAKEVLEQTMQEVRVAKAELDDHFNNKHPQLSLPKYLEIRAALLVAQSALVAAMAAPVATKKTAKKDGEPDTE